jgi:hypothetical protein
MIGVLDAAHRKQTKQDPCHFLHFVLPSKPATWSPGNGVFYGYFLIHTEDMSIRFVDQAKKNRGRMGDDVWGRREGVPGKEEFQSEQYELLQSSYRFGDRRAQGLGV